MKTSSDEQLSKRFYILNASVTVLLLIAIVISISQFGTETWGKAKQIGFITAGSESDSGWNRAQIRGIRDVCSQFGYDLMLRENVPVTAADCRATVQELANRGAKTIFFTHAYPSDEIDRLAFAFPRIQFYGVDEISHSSNVNGYSVRYIELRYLAGLLAGLHTKTGRIGYVAPFASPEVNQGINAFTLGVQAVNPTAQVLLVWTGDWSSPTNEERAVLTLKAEQADVLTYHQDSSVIPQTAERTALDFISLHENYPSYACFLAGITAHWPKIYQDILGQRHKQVMEAKNGSSWVGLTQDRADMTLSKTKTTPRERAVFESERWAFLHGKLVFTGEIEDRNGVRRCEAGESISTAYLQTRMDWLVKGVNVIGYERTAQ